MKQIWSLENGSVEFDNEEELMRYLKGEKPELSLIEGDNYKATFKEG